MIEPKCWIGQWCGEFLSMGTDAVEAHCNRQMGFAEDDDVIRHSRRIEPISLSEWPFREGERAPQGTGPHA